MSRASSAESSTASPPSDVATSNVYSCGLCPRVFASAHALGGHQNAHRKDRGDDLAGYIRQRIALDIKSRAGRSGRIPGVETNHNNNDNNSSKKPLFESGDPSRKRTIEAESEGLSLDLTLAIGGSSSAGENSGKMNYNYPDVLFPASEFLDTTVDLDLKL